MADSENNDVKHFGPRAESHSLDFEIEDQRNGGMFVKEQASKGKPKARSSRDPRALSKSWKGAAKRIGSIRAFPKTMIRPSITIFCFWTITAAGIVLGLLLLGLLVFFLFELFASFLSNVGALIALFCITFFLIRSLCVMATFPGSYWFLARSLEANYCSEQAVQTSQALGYFMQAISKVEVDELTDISSLAEVSASLTQLKQLLQSHLAICEHIKDTKLTAVQIKSVDLMVDLTKILQSLSIQIGQTERTLYALESQAVEQSFSPGGLFGSHGLEPTQANQFKLIENGSSLEDLHRSAKELETFLAPFCMTEESAWKFFKIFCKSKPMGRFDQARALMELKHGAKQFWVTSHDGVKIDCMIIPGTGAVALNSHRTISLEDMRSSTLFRSNSP